jgi:hypothetical protein
MGWGILMKLNRRLSNCIVTFSILTMVLMGCAPSAEKSKVILGSEISETEKSSDEIDKEDSNDEKENNEEKEKPMEQKEEEPAKPEVKLVEYTGAVEHIFIHPLIAYAEEAFDGDYQANGFDDWFVTAGEFKKIIDSLYKKNFILVDINTLYEEAEENGKKLIKRKPIMIPEGKKPLILSVDDLNYNLYMIGNGMVHKLVLDENGKIAAYTKQADGSGILTYDNEVVPILDAFVEEHPDFSLNGAKGTLALTGYEGVLGYRTNRQSPNKEEEKAKALKVVRRLKETGWNFASHSYGHPNMQTATYAKVVDDSTKWRNEVENIIGTTQVYIYPFGAHIKEGDKRLEYLQYMGFKIFCGVGSSSYEKLNTGTNAVITDRRHVDGLTLRKQRDKFLDLYDADEIIDLTVRPQR